MSLQVVGAGVGRTGTASLKKALEHLLGAPCYHMYEVFDHPEHVPMWSAATRNEPVDWDLMFANYSAAVDWPASAFWPELSQRYPDALLVFSRRDPQAWWESASTTIFCGLSSRRGAEHSEWLEMVLNLLDCRFTPQISDHDACIAAYLRHEKAVLETVPRNRLLVWEPKDGWAPLCNALDLPIPDEEFPKVNTKEEFLARVAAADAERAAAAR